MRSISEDLAKKWLKITFLDVKVLLLIDFSTLLNSIGLENTVLFGIASMYPAQGSDNLCNGASGEALPSSTAPLRWRLSWLRKKTTPSRPVGTPCGA
jgi:hypothetical protein